RGPGRAPTFRIGNANRRSVRPIYRVGMAADGPAGAAAPPINQNPSVAVTPFERSNPNGLAVPNRTVCIVIGTPPSVGTLGNATENENAPTALVATGMSSHAAAWLRSR